MEPHTYVGSELELFAEARRWKRYWADTVEPYVRGDVLEVGAGLGANTELLVGPSVRNWTCLEPDPRLLVQLEAKLSDRSREPPVKTICGTISSVEGCKFDTILYIDVLEHIEDDRSELQRANACLRPGGHIVVLSPAHTWLFTDFDASIGHWRRYNRRLLREITPSGLRIQRLDYLDCVGVIASLANRLMLKQTMPTMTQIHVWDGWMIPASRILDGLLKHNVGKSIVAVWAKS